VIAVLIAMAASSGATARLVALDRARTAQERQLAQAEQPLAELLAQAERLSRRPALLTLARPDAARDAVRTRALIAALAPQIKVRAAALRREILATDALRAATEQQLARLLDPTARPADAARRSMTRLAALGGPLQPIAPAPRGTIYRLPPGSVIAGMGERIDVGPPARGLTLATAAAAPILAPAAARIGYAGPFRGYGDIVVLDHGHGWITLLAGLAQVTAVGGQTVTAGTPLGRMGNSAPRLTIELRHAGRPIDPVAMALQ
jgi:murein hydrolase activator